MKLVAIKDVARESGATSVAVSLVLNGHGKTQRIALATSNRIIEAAKRLNSENYFAKN